MSNTTITPKVQITVALRVPDRTLNQGNENKMIAKKAARTS